MPAGDGTVAGRDGVEPVQRGKGSRPRRPCATVLAAAAGLQAAHEKNVLHRDIKPENLMFSSEGVLKVTDFGIAKVVGGDSTLATRAGEVLGTPAYIAPEQARGAPLSPATDVYALATMLYELLSGQLPFPEDADAMALLFKHAYEDPAPLDQKAPTVPQAGRPGRNAGVGHGARRPLPQRRVFRHRIGRSVHVRMGAGLAGGRSGAGYGSGVRRSRDRAHQRAVNRPNGDGPNGDGPNGVGPNGVRPNGDRDGLGSSRSEAAGPTVAGRPPPPPLQRARATVIRPVSTERAGGTGLTELQQTSFANLVPVQQIVKSPPRPRWPLAVAVVAFAAAVVLAFVGLGSGSSLGGNLPPGTVEVSGVPLRAGAVPSLNLSGPVTVTVLANGPAASTARMSFVLMGHTAFQSNAPLVPAGDGARTARIDLTKARYVVTGHTAAQVDLLKDGAMPPLSWPPALYRAPDPARLVDRRRDRANRGGALLAGLYRAVRPVSMARQAEGERHPGPGHIHGHPGRCHRGSGLAGRRSAAHIGRRRGLRRPGWGLGVGTGRRFVQRRSVAAVASARRRNVRVPGRQPWRAERLERR